MDWLLEILSWPAEWSALHGIAEIKTPILKVSTRTDATPTKYIVQRTGTAYPAAGSRGLRFPFRAPGSRKYTESRAFKSGLENPFRMIEDRPAWYATDNGFSSVGAMERAHRALCNAAEQVLGTNRANVLDLGCGNGVLLRTLGDRVPGMVPFGIDVDPERVAHARTICRAHAKNFFAGDMFDDSDSLHLFGGRKFELAIVMPGRMVEAGPVRSRTLLQMLAKHCDKLLVYAYGDWLVRDGGLAGLARAGGFDVGSLAADAQVALATVRADAAFSQEGTVGDRNEAR